jgi:hypothetical protein
MNTQQLAKEKLVSNVDVDWRSRGNGGEKTYKLSPEPRVQVCPVLARRWPRGPGGSA